MARFAEEVQSLGNRLGVILVQLPPKLAFDVGVVERFFRGLRQQLDAAYVCEPRHPSWSSQEANDVLTSSGVARVAADPLLWPGAGEPGGFSQIVYFRWHGQPRKYYSDYDVMSLTRLRHALITAEARGAHAWCIFDNTVLGHATGNALWVNDAS